MKKLKQYLRKEMDKIPTDKQMKQGKEPFMFCYAQAKFDMLMDIDRTLNLGVFFKNKENI